MLENGRASAARAVVKLRALTSAVRPPPDFIIIGARKCATTSLFRYLAKHPQIVPALHKEVHFFDANYDRGRDWYLAHFPSAYHRKLAGVMSRGRALSGEATPDYLCTPQAPQRIFALNPAIKLILIMRDPVNACYSAYQHGLRQGTYGEERNFDTCVGKETQYDDDFLRSLFTNGLHTAHRSGKTTFLAEYMYVEWLNNWLRVFPRGQICIFITKMLLRQPESEMRRLFDFLELPYHDSDIYGERFNEHPYRAVSSPTRKQLAEYFSPYNQRLAQTLGLELPWTENRASKLISCDAEFCGTQSVECSGRWRYQGKPLLSVILPTHNRHELLTRTISSLFAQSLAAESYEIVVVDDGSTPPVSLANMPSLPRCKVVRLEKRGASAARNAGVAEANGDIIAFVDDDATVESDFLATHLRAHCTWSDAIVVGSIRLPDARTPFMRFRHSVELKETPLHTGLIERPNFCSACNMSMSRARFLQLGGFSESIMTGEDQDLSFRHGASGGAIVFLAEAVATHDDSVSDILTYCRRVEAATRNYLPFCQAYPHWRENLLRARVNGPHHWMKDFPLGSIRKLVKRLLAVEPMPLFLARLCSLVERYQPGSGILQHLYSLLLGVHIFRGYRSGLRRYPQTTQPVPHAHGQIGRRLEPDG